VPKWSDSELGGAIARWPVVAGAAKIAKKKSAKKKSMVLGARRWRASA
jgi:hypothetical protein